MSDQSTGVVNSTPKLLSGRPIRAERATRLIQAIKGLSYTPKLAIIQVGDRTDSAAYIKAKRIFAEQIGAGVALFSFLENVSSAEIVQKIQECNFDSSVQGIIVQLPLPVALEKNRDEIIQAIDSRKDVDGLTTINQHLLAENNPAAIIPATARGVKELLEYYHIDLRGKRVAVVGRSQLVGAPIAQVCRHAGADVIVCHSKTVDLAHETSKADIIIVAVGRVGLISTSHVKKDAIVIDVGINRTSDGSLKGDVDFDQVKSIVSAITPVPGGVGQMTVLALFENLIDACKM